MRQIKIIEAQTFEELENAVNTIFEDNNEIHVINTEYKVINSDVMAYSFCIVYDIPKPEKTEKVI